MEQWKRFAFSNHGMEAYFRVDRLRNDFVLCRYFSASYVASMIRAAGVHPMWSGEWGWKVSQAIATRSRPPVQGSHDVPGGGCTIRMRLRLPSLRAAGAPKEAKINQ